MEEEKMTFLSMSELSVWLDLFGPVQVTKIEPEKVMPSGNTLYHLYYTNELLKETIGIVGIAIHLLQNESYDTVKFDKFLKKIKPRLTGKEKLTNNCIECGRILHDDTEHICDDCKR